jgi:hypothetical protein
MNADVISEFLIVQGKVPEDLLKKLNIKANLIANADWFYLDYSPIEYSLTSDFDIILAGPNTSLIPQIYEIKLKEVVDQFGFNLECIPKGYKTIALLSFSPNMPQPILDLPFLKGWSSNSKQVSLAQHNQIRFENRLDYISDLIKIIAFQIHYDKDNYKSIGKTLFTKPEFIHKFHDNYKLDVEIANQLLNDLMTLGYIKEKSEGQETKLTFVD